MKKAVKIGYSDTIATRIMGRFREKGCRLYRSDTKEEAVALEANVGYVPLKQPSNEALVRGRARTLAG